MATMEIIMPVLVGMRGVATLYLLVGDSGSNAGNGGGSVSSCGDIFISIYIHKHRYTQII